MKPQQKTNKKNSLPNKASKPNHLAAMAKKISVLERQMAMCVEHAEFDRPGKPHILKGKEEVKVITVTGTGFEGNQITLNPASPILLPLGHFEAQLYNRYRFLNLKFTYSPAVSTYATGGQNGSMIMVWVPETTEELPSDISALSRAAIRSKFFMPHEHCSFSLGKEHFARLTSRYLKMEGTDGFVGPPELWMSGTFFIGWEGVAATPSIGRLDVSYEVEAFDKYTITSEVPPSRLNNMVSTEVSGAIAASDTFQNVVFSSGTINSNFGSGLVETGSVITCLPGIYEFTMDITYDGSATAMTSAEIRLYDNTAASALVSYIDKGSSATERSVSGRWVFRIASENAYAFQMKSVFSSGTVEATGWVTARRLY